MPFNRMQEAVALATSIDTATNRRDEIGMDMLRDLLPELREIIDDINAALHEVDELLFIGLRDEAITLNDPEFARVAARLNLEDKEAWPAVSEFFQREGITPPPRLDFETLGALESAHAEIEQLGRQLDRLRRLVLERAPVLTRLTTLRRIRDADGTKPVWAETIADHERARLAELPDAVKRAIAAKDPDRIAELHMELVDPDWTVSVPKDLVKATRGAELWSRLREAVPAAEAAAVALEAGLAGVESGFDAAAVAALRQARHAWYEASGAVHECLGGLADCPNVAALARGEGLEARFSAIGTRCQQSLDWLEQEDAREAAIARRDQALAQLESLVAHLPATAREEKQWLAGVAHLAQELGGQEALPDGLRQGVANAVRLVRGRPGRRLLVKIACGAAVAAAVIALLMVIGRSVQRASRYSASISELKEFSKEARACEYVQVPSRVGEIADEYPDDERVSELREEIVQAVDEERERRESVGNALASHARLHRDAQLELERRRKGEGALEPWPDSVRAAAKAYKSARAKGGKPENRGGGGESKPAAVSPSAASVLAGEEEGIEKARQAQESIEKSFDRADWNEYAKRHSEISADIADKPSPGDCLPIRRKINALRDAMKAVSRSDPLRSSEQLPPPAGWEKELTRLDEQLSDLERASVVSPPLEPPSSSSPDIEVGS